MSNYTFEDVKRVLHEVVAERPDYIYQYPEGADECTYSDGKGGSSCLIGEVIFRLDPEAFKRIAENEWGEVDTYNRWGEIEGTRWEPVQILAVYEIDWAKQFEPHEIRAMAAAQSSQDVGNVWGQAEEAMIRFLEGDAN